MKIHGKVVAKIQQEGGAQIARIQVYKKKKTAACLMRVFDIADDGELNIGDQVTVEVLRTRVPDEEEEIQTLQEVKEFSMEHLPEGISSYETRVRHYVKNEEVRPGPEMVADLERMAQ